MNHSCFPGTPGSRYVIVPDDAALQYGVRVVVVDRPGYGLSTLDSDRDLLDWPNGVVELMDSLEIETTAVAGHSGGGAFVLACTRAIPERLTGVGLVSSVAPFSIPEINQQMSEEEQHIGELVETAPGELREFAETIFGDAHEKPAVAYEGILAGSPPPDRTILEREEIREMMIANISEAFRHGPAVWAHESEPFFQPWEFDPTEITEHIDLWQGEQDREVSPFMGAI